MKTFNTQKLLAASLFLITGLEELRFKMRMLQVLDAVPNDNHRAKRMQQWADDLWRRGLKCPAFPTGRFNSPAFIVPAEENLPVGTIFTVEDVPHKEYRIQVTDQVFEIDPLHSRLEERNLAGKMIERVISDKLNSLKNKYWRAEWSLYYNVSAENETASNDAVRAYRGLKFGVLFMEDGALYLAADVRTRYIGRDSLARYLQEGREAALSDHLNLDIEMENRATFVRDNGPAKFSCRFTGYTGKTVSEYRFPLDGRRPSILDYYTERYPRLRLDPADQAVFFGNLGKKSEATTDLAAPASRLFPVFTTDDDALRECSIKPQMGPEDRIQTIRLFLGDLSELSYGGKSFSVSHSYFTKQRSIFLPPRLEYGRKQTLSPFAENAPPGTRLPDIDQAIAAWRSSKVPMLYKNGPFLNEPLPDVVVFYPETLPKDTREAFLGQLELEIQKQTGCKMNLLARRAYRVGRNETEGVSLLEAVKTEIATQPELFLGLIVLWDRFSTNVYVALKERLKRHPSQCVTEDVVATIAKTWDPVRSLSRVRNLALGVLTCAGVQPWVLADSLHHDVYVGIDTLQGRVCYHFIYGVGGRCISASSGASIKRGKARESLNKPELKQKFEGAIREIHRQGHALRSIIVHRDGRWWSRESQALQESVLKLQDDRILSRDCAIGVVEIHKSHTPIRLFTQDGPSAGQLVNPLPGTYLKLDSQRVLLATTGRPGPWEKGDGRTAGTLLLNLAESSKPLDVTDLAEDAYRLTHLNWNAPEIEISVPVTIRWNDDALRVSLLSQKHEEEDDDLGNAPEQNSEQPQEVAV